MDVFTGNPGIYTNVSADNAQYQPTYFMKNDTDRMYGSFVTKRDFTAENWIFDVYNGSDSYSGRAGLYLPSVMSYEQPSYLGSFFVVGDDESDPWGSNPHIGFRPDDGSMLLYTSRS